MLSGDIFVSMFIINLHSEISQISAHLVIISNYQLKLISNSSVMDGLVVFKYSERKKSNFMPPCKYAGYQYTESISILSFTIVYQQTSHSTILHATHLPKTYLKVPLHHTTCFDQHWSSSGIQNCWWKLMHLCIPLSSVVLPIGLCVFVELSPCRMYRSNIIEIMVMWQWMYIHNGNFDGMDYGSVQSALLF
jgi:hypothetical protein